MPLTWPVSSDITNFFSGLNLDATTVAAVVADADIDNEIGAAIEEFENQTDFNPYLETNQVRYYSPPGPYSGTESIYGMLAIGGGGRILTLDAGLLSINTLSVGVTNTSAGTVLTVNQDYWLRPPTAPQNERPYMYIEFLYFQRGAPNSIKIDGQWGYVKALDGIQPDVFRAIVRKVAVQIAPQLQTALFGGLVSWSQADVKEQYGKAIDIDAWQATFDKAVGRYRKLVVV